MRGLYGFFCVLLIGVIAGLAIFIGDTEMHAQRWNARATKIEHVEKLNLQVLEAHQYSRSLMDTVRMQACENGILCERDIVHANQVAVFDEENRMLKASLADAIDRLEKQDKQINDLIDETGRLYYQVQVLEAALSKFSLHDNGSSLSLDLTEDVCLLSELVQSISVLSTIINFAL